MIVVSQESFGLRAIKSRMHACHVVITCETESTAAAPATSAMKQTSPITVSLDPRVASQNRSSP